MVMSPGDRPAARRTVEEMDLPRIGRRQLLQGATALGGLALLGCHSDGPPRTTPTPGPTTVPPPTRTAPVDWDALARQLSGTLTRPGDRTYEQVSRLFNRRFDDRLPAAVASVTSEADAVACIRFAADLGVPLRVRAGGHSYVGGSVGPGLVVDLRPMSGVTAGQGTATIGAGAALIDVYDQLAARGVSIPAGSCPTVGLAGLALGGGMGVVARRYGLTCDRLTSARVVLADGNVVTASANSEPDLFWALRGGGGSFGLVTSLTFATHPTQDLTTFFWAWPWPAAALVADGWQRWSPGQPDQLWSTCHLLATDGADPTAAVAGVFVGSPAGLDAALAGLRDAVGVAPKSASRRSRSYADTMRLEAGCASTPVAECRLIGGVLERDAFVAASDFFTAPVPVSALERLAGAIERRQADPSLGVGGVGFDSWGGAVGRVAPDATAFVHRDATFSAQWTASWQQQPGNGPQAANESSLRAMQATLHEHGNGQAYQNYADPALPDPLTAYYGDNLARLR
ncbi:MAG: FAD-binding oxidoreductase, partial [Frankiales bacterium]|nr:FAD-binding oxidoreductase [Frankiales bacterium]